MTDTRLPQTRRSTPCRHGSCGRCATALPAAVPQDAAAPSAKRECQCESPADPIVNCPPASSSQLRCGIDGSVGGGGECYPAPIRRWQPWSARSPSRKPRKLRRGSRDKWAGGRMRHTVGSSDQVRHVVGNRAGAPKPLCRIDPAAQTGAGRILPPASSDVATPGRVRGGTVRGRRAGHPAGR